MKNDLTASVLECIQKIDNIREGIEDKRKTCQEKKHTYSIV
ncbi:hypothetical protein SAMN05444369_101295 [Capnocytophaga haemolytica]|uniref:Uncharacterized protein n=1 Tax=Capnocytophaga haemolytica TaxID=45243 RepID=A0AAX2GWR1_9FLAO|nr:hypothetical protein SAMN05444369_101295 [Capnocytophaga haemolytica]SNV04928.1 Uncharacterised protein [Capnocytophaga haemolytica]